MTNFDIQVYVVVNVTSGITSLPDFLTERFSNLRLLKLNFLDVVRDTPLWNLYSTGNVLKNYMGGDAFAFPAVSDTLRSIQGGPKVYTPDFAFSPSSAGSPSSTSAAGPTWTTT